MFVKTAEKCRPVRRNGNLTGFGFAGPVGKDEVRPCIRQGMAGNVDELFIIGLVK